MEKTQAQYKARHDKHMVDHQLQVGNRVWHKKLKPIHYGPFTILEKSGANDFRLDLQPYMKIYSVVNVQNLKLFEPPMIMHQGEEVSIPSVDEFSHEYLDELQEYIILDRRTRNSCRGDVDYLLVGLKGTHPRKEKWIEKDKVREIFPHLFFD